LLDTIPYLVNIRINTRGVPFYKSGIPDKENFHFLTDIKVDSAKAVQIATKDGFQEGIEPWIVRLVFEKHKTDEKQYYWNIKNKLDPGDRNGCRASGKVLVIDAITGQIVSELNWSSDCS